MLTMAQVIRNVIDPITPRWVATAPVVHRMGDAACLREEHG